MIKPSRFIYQSLAYLPAYFFCCDARSSSALLLLLRISPTPSSNRLSNMATHEDTMPEETTGYKLSQPKQSLAEYQQMGM